MREALKKARKAAGLTQKQLAERVGCSRENYAMLETGKSDGSIKVWKAIREALNITPEDILYIITEGE